MTAERPRVGAEATGPALLGRLLARAFAPGRPNRFAACLRSRPANVAAIVGGLDASHSAVRVDALRALSAAHDREAADPAVVDRLLVHAARQAELDDELRWTLIALGRARVEGLLEGFRRVLAEAPPSARFHRDRDPRILAGACYALGGARCERSLAALCAVAARGAPEAAPAAVWALGQIGDPAALPTLHRLLAQRRLLAWIPGALGDIGAPGSLGMLAPVLTDPRPPVRFVAAAAILSIALNRTEVARTSLGRRTADEVAAAWAREPDGRTAALLGSTMVALRAPLDAGLVRKTFGLEVATPVEPQRACVAPTPLTARSRAR